MSTAAKSRLYWVAEPTKPRHNQLAAERPVNEAGKPVLRAIRPRKGVPQKLNPIRRNRRKKAAAERTIITRTKATIRRARSTESESEWNRRPAVNHRPVTR